MAAAKYKTMYCEGEIIQVSSDLTDITVFGKLQESVSDGFVRYVAASPPDYRATYTGSGLPFASHAQAFHNTPNRGIVQLVDNTFEIKLMYPNSYYIGLGTVMVPPTLYVFYRNSEGVDRNIPIQISTGVPYRTLTYPPNRKDAMFYKWGWSMPVRTQEQVLRDSGYPSFNTMDINHWGLKPPL
jgi:hypothetical protein